MAIRNRVAVLVAVALAAATWVAAGSGPAQGQTGQAAPPAWQLPESPPATSVRPPPAPKDFVDVLDVFDVAISPDGQSVVSAHAQWFSAADRIGDKILITPTATPRAPRVTIDRDGLIVRWVLWPKDRYIVAAVIGITADRRRLTFSDRIVAIHPETGAERIIYDAPLRRSYSRYRPPRIVWYGPRDGSTIMIISHQQGRGDLALLDLTTARQTLVERGTEATVNWIVNGAGRAVMRIDRDDRSGVLRYYGRQAGGSGWRLLETTPAEVGTGFSVVGRSDRSDEVIVVGQPDDAPTRGIYRYDLTTGELGDALFTHDRYDVSSAFVDFRDGRYYGAWYYDDVLQYQFANPDTQQDADSLRTQMGQQRSWVITDADDDTSHWLIYSSAPQDPGTWWTFDRDTDQLIRLFDAQADILAEDLSPMEPWRWTASDGLEISGYLTRPKASAPGPRPLVVIPHGGPEMRDVLSFDPWAQFLASRGYLVFQPNFRGSDGFGRAFRDAGRRQWGLRSQQDIEDGVTDLIEKGLVDPGRMAIIGASYGGYAALIAATDPQTRYRCAMSIAGVTDLPALLDHDRRRSVQAATPELYDYMLQVIGDPVADAEQLRATSPIHRVANLRIPLLVMQPAEDQRVPMAQFTTFLAAAHAAGRTVQSAIIHDEGHGDWSADTHARVVVDMNWFLTRCMMD